MTVTNSAMIAENSERWGKAKVTRRSAFSAVAARLDAATAKSRYQAVSQKTAVPWPAIAVIHEREASQAWTANIAQGDRWDKKSIHVPAGRGPFPSWDAAANDALMNCPPYAGRWNDWSPGGTLTILEKYNGTGYATRGVPSPYIWSGTDRYVSGKYIRDHVYDPNTVDVQLGCAGLLKSMMEIDPSIRFGEPVVSPRPTPAPPKEIIKDATKTERKARAGGVAGSVAGAGNETGKTTTEVPAKSPFLHSAIGYGAIGIGIAVAIVATVLIARKVKSINQIW